MVLSSICSWRSMTRDRSVLPRRQSLSERFAAATEPAAGLYRLHSAFPTEFCRLRIASSNSRISPRLSHRFIRSTESFPRRLARGDASGEKASLSVVHGADVDSTDFLRRDWRWNNCSAPPRRVDVGQDATGMGLVDRKGRVSVLIYVA